MPGMSRSKVWLRANNIDGSFSAGCGMGVWWQCFEKNISSVVGESLRNF